MPRNTNNNDDTNNNDNTNNVVLDDDVAEVDVLAGLPDTVVTAPQYYKVTTTAQAKNVYSKAQQVQWMLYHYPDRATVTLKVDSNDLLRQLDIGQQSHASAALLGISGEPANKRSRAELELTPALAAKLIDCTTKDHQVKEGRIQLMNLMASTNPNFQGNMAVFLPVMWNAHETDFIDRFAKELDNIITVSGIFAKLSAENNMTAANALMITKNELIKDVTLEFEVFADKAKYVREGKEPAKQFFPMLKMTIRIVAFYAKMRIVNASYQVVHDHVNSLAYEACTSNKTLWETQVWDQFLKDTIARFSVIKAPPENYAEKANLALGATIQVHTREGGDKAVSVAQKAFQNSKNGFQRR